MMSTAHATGSAATGGFDSAHFEAFLAHRGEPSWLLERRREAFASFERAATPTLRDEEWRRTDIRPLKLGQFEAPRLETPSAEARQEIESSRLALEAHYAGGLTQVDSVLAQNTAAGRLPAGVLFMGLGEAVAQHPELLERYLLTQAVRPDQDLFAALHGAFWTGGALLYVPRGVTIDEPLYHLIGLSRQGSSDLSHTLVILEEGAQATLVQETAGAKRDRAALHVGAVELIVGPSARLRFVNIQNWDRQTWHFSREKAILDRDATIQWTVGGLGSRLAKVNQDVALVGQGAKAQVNGVIFATERQNLTYITRQDHVAPHTTSDLLYKCGLKDQSRLVWRGMIRVEKDAQRTDAYQKNDNLVLSEDARTDSIPGLEIEANDVRCTHGATVGRVDDDMVFYLRSRGISREEATRLIVEGFFANVYDRIPIEPVRETLRSVVASRLEL